MKKLIFTVIAVMLFGVFVQAQDLITKRSGEDIQAKILEVNQTEIKYKKFDNQDGPTFTISKSDVLMVRYENGTNEVFTQTENRTNNYNQGSNNYNNRNIPAGISPNMPYKYYKDKYDHRFYVPQYGDPYSPALGGWGSFFIPGLGQILLGETGRGLGYFGGVVGSYVVMAIGSAMVIDGDDIGALFMVAGYAGGLTIHICSIVDGVRVAKRKNMYMQDIRSMSTIDFKLSPYIETVSIGNQRITPIGLSLQLSF